MDNGEPGPIPVKQKRQNIINQVNFRTIILAAFYIGLTIFEQVKFISGELKNKLKLKKNKTNHICLTQEHLKRNTKKQLAF